MSTSETTSNENCSATIPSSPNATYYISYSKLSSTFQVVGCLIFHCARPTRSFQFSMPHHKGVAEAALYCAHRATTASSWGLCEQEGHVAAPFSSFSASCQKCGAS